MALRVRETRRPDARNRTYPHALCGGSRATCLLQDAWRHHDTAREKPPFRDNGYFAWPNPLHAYEELTEPLATSRFRIRTFRSGLRAHERASGSVGKRLRPHRGQAESARFAGQDAPSAHRVPPALPCATQTAGSSAGQASPPRAPGRTPSGRAAKRGRALSERVWATATT